MTWFDVGVNLTNNRFQADLQQVMERARQAGVAQMLITGTDEADSEQALMLADQWNCLSTAGVHPHYAAGVSEAYLTRIRQLAGADRVRAIGECGLDFNRNFSPKEEQLRVFEAQLELATELRLPVFLHERDAFAEQIRLLRRYRPALTGGVAHCFTGDRAQMEAYLELDLHIGITGWLCDDRRGQSLREAVLHLPLDRLLLETDAPYLAPRHVRPRIERNEPCHLPVVGSELAALTGQEPVTIAQHSYDNACRLFKPGHQAHDQT
ncbi:TatD family hydrolase [Bowmanella dokdonensis]|uniref:TatD family hydrolase n=1 Tax=Bowmanella dokdonensis TaxID=751969 RepID=A0A939DJ88_9ALTE|nr:TatD family hydrolase [Bowmanella dokdonensis]MBN7823729.1 TatD family hydrolase [Bowmanella dokdonensis]